MKGKFNAGNCAGSKIDPFKASIKMRNLKIGDQFVFSKDKYLTTPQILPYFSGQKFRTKEELKHDILKHI